MTYLLEEGGRTDCGHGHVWPRSDGVRARCGGPGLCNLCSTDAANKAKAMGTPNPASPEPTATWVSRMERQATVKDWCANAFGIEQASSIPQRGVRLAEEAIEAAQSCGVEAEMLHRLIDHIYAKPVGALSQELGGVGVTTLALAAAVGLSADDCEEAEVRRVLSKPLEHFRKRNEAKNSAGFDTKPAAKDEANAEEKWWVILHRSGFAPITKGPFVKPELVERMLRDLYAIHPGCTCIVITSNEHPGPESGTEWLSIYEHAIDRRR